MKKADLLKAVSERLGVDPKTLEGKTNAQLTAMLEEEPERVEVKAQPQTHEERHLPVMNRNVRYNGDLYEVGQTVEGEVGNYFVKLGYAN